MSELLSVLNFGVKVEKARRAIRGGREYFVAPLSLINPGVLEGSKGKLFYPPDQVAENTSAWDGLPLTLYHPQSPEGRHVSARTPGVLERQGLGFSENSHFNGKLRNLGWFDIERLQHPHRNDPLRDQKLEVYRRLDRGQPIELSTGLYTDNKKAPAGANFKGRPYDYVATNYRPDHIAILPDQVGACSINDGCGVGVVNAFTLNADMKDVMVWNAVPDKECSVAHVPEGPCEWDKRKASVEVSNMWSDEAREAAARARAMNNSQLRKEHEKNDRAVTKESGKAMRKPEHAGKGLGDIVHDEGEHSPLARAVDAHAITRYEMQRRGLTHNEASGDSDQSLRIRKQPGYGHRAESAILDEGSSEGGGLKVTKNEDEEGGGDMGGEGMNENEQRAAARLELMREANQAVDNTWSDEAREAALEARRNAGGGKSQHEWHTYAGGTFAAEGKHAYSTSTEHGEYHIQPVSTPQGRHRGYSVDFANTKGKVGGGLWHHLGMSRSPQTAKTMAAAHHDLLSGGGTHNQATEKPTENRSLLRRFIDLFTENAITKRGSGPHPDFEPAEEELHEDDAAAELVGIQATPDGRVLGTPKRQPDSTGIAGSGDEDHHDPSTVFDPERRIKADRKTGYSQPVVVSNAWSEEAREAAAEARRASSRAYDKSDKVGAGVERMKGLGHSEQAAAHERMERQHLDAARGSSGREEAMHREAAAAHASAGVAHKRAGMLKAMSAGHGQVGNVSPLIAVINESGGTSYVINPAVSEKQRKYLNWAFGHDWVVAHGFDNPGELPEEADEKETKNALAENAWSEEARQAAAEARRASGHANKKSIAQTDKLFGKGAKPQLSTIGERADTIGEHEDAIRGHLSAFHSPGSHEMKEAHSRAIAAHQKAITLKSTTHNSTGFVDGSPLAGPQHHGEMTIMATEHGPAEGAAHMASKQAAHASLDSYHEKAMGHAHEALNHSSEECHDGAAEAHGKAAAAHESAATKARKAGDTVNAEQHDSAAAMHRKAASMHKATLNACECVVEQLPPMEQMVENCSFTCEFIGGEKVYKLKGPWAAKKRITTDPSLTGNVSPQGAPMTDAEIRMMEGLVANCSDPATRRQAAAMLARNKKHKEPDEDDDETENDEGEGKNQHSFDLKPGEGKGEKPIQAGGKGVEEEYELSGNVRQEMANMSPTLRRVVASALAREQEEKMILVNRLLIGVRASGSPADNAERTRIGNALLKKSKKELMDLVQLKGPVGNSSYAGPEEDFGQTFLGSSAPGLLTQPIRRGQLTENERKDVIPRQTLDLSPDNGAGCSPELWKLKKAGGLQRIAGPSTQRVEV